MATQPKSWLLPLAAFVAGASATMVATFHAPLAREVPALASPVERLLCWVRWPKPGPLFEREFRVTRDAEHPLVITEDRSQDLPYVFGDCDLDATLEVPEGGELDIVVRKVEFTIREKKGHGRFSGLRLSALAEGPAWRTREQLLFDTSAPGGLKVAPGLGATVHLELRGRTATATVAGRKLPPFECDDLRGEIGFVAHGGSGVIRYLHVSEPAFTPQLEDWVVSGACAALAALLALFAKARGMRAFLALLLVPAGGYLAKVLVFSALAPLATPSLPSTLLGSLCCLPLWLAVVCPRGRMIVGTLAVALGAAMLELCVRNEERRLEPLCDERLDLFFGRGSSTAPYDALCTRLRSRAEIHTPVGDATRVLFLGGEDLFEAGDSPDQWVGVQVAGALVAKLRRPVQGMVAATGDASTLQQFVLYREFYRKLAPQVVVLGVPSDESEPRLRVGLRELLQATGGGRHALPRGSSRLLDLVARVRAPAVPASSPEELQETLREAVKWFTAAKVRVVLATGFALGEEHAKAVATVAEELVLPLVRDALGSDGKPAVAAFVLAISAQLAAAGSQPGSQPR